jgi:uncharacterized protein
MTLSKTEDDFVHSLNTQGFACIGPVLSENLCVELISLYKKEEMFRSTIDMRRYRFGEGEYKYFKHPLPASIQLLRARFYQSLVPVANKWMSRLGMDVRYPADLEEFLARCHAKKSKKTYAVNIAL